MRRRIERNEELYRIALINISEKDKIQPADYQLNTIDLENQSQGFTINSPAKSDIKQNIHKAEASFGEPNSIRPLMSQRQHNIGPNITKKVDNEESKGRKLRHSQQNEHNIVFKQVQSIIPDVSLQSGVRIVQRSSQASMSRKRPQEQISRLQYLSKIQACRFKPFSRVLQSPQDKFSFGQSKSVLLKNKAVISVNEAKTMNLFRSPKRIDRQNAIRINPEYFELLFGIDESFQ